MQYVKIGSMIIEVEEYLMDSLFAHLWENEDVEKLGADTDIENSFGPVTHSYINFGILVKVGA